MMSEVNNFPVQIDPKVIPILKRIVARNAEDNSFIRIGVKGGGCSGFEYVIKADHRSKPNDIVLEIAELRIVCDPKSKKFLEGAQLVASGNLIGGGLKFDNPNVATSCGCGSSFTPKSLRSNGE